MSLKSCASCEHLVADSWWGTVDFQWRCAVRNCVSNDITSPRDCHDWSYEPGADAEDIADEIC